MTPNNKCLKTTEKTNSTQLVRTVLIRVIRIVDSLEIKKDGERC
jgi:hypothetical protein